MKTERQKRALGRMEIDLKHMKHKLRDQPNGEYRDKLVDKLNKLQHTINNTKRNLGMCV